MRVCVLVLLLCLAIPTLQKGLECPVCQQFVGMIDKKEIDEDEHLQEKMDKECRKILDAAIIEVYCEKLVNQEFDKIIAGIKNNQRPDVICKDIGMC